MARMEETGALTDTVVERILELEDITDVGAMASTSSMAMLTGGGNSLVEILRRLTEGGNTVVVIEHNLDVIKTADYVIDIGPEGGDGGGRIIAKGTPEEVAKNKNSHTGQYIGKMLEKNKNKY